MDVIARYRSHILPSGYMNSISKDKGLEGWQGLGWGVERAEGFL
jgi:hypothetical protein